MAETAISANDVRAWLKATFTAAGTATRARVQLGAFGIEVPPVFYQDAFDDYAQDVVGTIDATARIWIDFPTSTVLHATAEIPSRAGTRTASLDADAITTAISLVLEGCTGSDKLGRDHLERVLQAVWSQMPEIESIQVLDANVARSLMAAFHASSKSDGIQNLGSLFDAADVMLAAYRQFQVRRYPLENKLDSFCRAFSIKYPDIHLRDLAQLASIYLPEGPIGISLVGRTSVVWIILDRDANGTVSIRSVPSDLNEGGLPDPETFSMFARSFRKKSNVKRVLFLSVKELVSITLNLEDGVVDGELFEHSTPYSEVITQLALRYLRGFEKTWYMVPKPAIMQLPTRVMARVLGAKIDLPRLDHVRFSKKLVVWAREFLGEASRLVIAVGFEENKPGSVIVREISTKDGFPVAIKSLDPSIAGKIVLKDADATGIAKQIHATLDSEGDLLPLHVIVITPTMARAIGASLNAMSRPWLAFPWQIWKAVKVALSPKSLGIWPRPAKVASIQANKSGLVIKAIGRAIFLPYL